MHVTRRLILFAITACLACAFGWSSPEDDSYTRIARLSYIEGNVSFQHSSDVDWSAASINFPLEPGDRIYVGSGGRAEIQFDDGSAFRLAENTDIEILSLQEDLIQLRILLGLATLNVVGNADFEINTPAAAFNAIREGIYRFDVVENGDTDAIVRKGELEAANNEFSGRIRSGELYHFVLRQRNPEISSYDRRDEWDEWNDRRNADMRIQGNIRYLPDNVYIGASELNRYGRWMNVASYGTAWIPYDADPLWSPDSVGRWCYRPFFGWTWVSYEPWGWLPYHYGRWHHSSLYGWCWLPGPAFSFNFWSPGLVSFYSGPGWISWCPLGPGDYYDIHNYHYNHGIYGHQMAELRGLHTRGPGNSFNRDVPGAFRTVHLDQFKNGSFNNNKLADTRWGNVNRPWSQGALVQGRLSIQPTSTSFNAVPGRPAAGSTVANPLPAVVRNVPAQSSSNREGFTRITNPQINSVSSRGIRSQAEPATEVRDGSGSKARVIQVPRNPAGNGLVEQREQRVIGSRGSESGGNSAVTARSREGTSPAVQPNNAAPSNQQNPSRSRIERGVPQQQTSPQRAPESRPGSDSRMQNNFNEARPGVGRWSESNPGGTRLPAWTLPNYRTQSYSNPGRWNNSNPGITSSPNHESAPASGNEGRSINSNPGAMRSQPGRTPEYSAPQQSRPSFGSGGSRPGAAPSQSFGGSNNRGSSGRGAPEGHSSGGGSGRR
jgi:hypothetical protein